MKFLIKNEIVDKKLKFVIKKNNFFVKKNRILLSKMFFGQKSGFRNEIFHQRALN